MTSLLTSPREYPEARIDTVVDGDTLDLVVSGLDVDVHIRGRLYGINAPELHTLAGAAAREFVLRWSVARAGRCGLVTFKTRSGTGAREKYGRWLVQVLDPVTGESLTGEMIRAGHAVAWDGKGTRPT